MILWFRHLPQLRMDLSEWTPFIQSHSLRKHFMKYVYLLQVIIFLIPFLFRGWFPHIDAFYLILLWFFVFLIHETLHIIVINKKGDISLTFRGIFFWLHTNAILSKPRFWLFMSLPFLGLSVVPFIVSFFLSGELKSIFLFVSWINTLISASDIINSLLIAVKPRNSVFCKGYYQLQ